MKPRSKRFYIVLSIAAAVATMSVKFVGYLLTGSVGLFSDAAESVVNLVAALVALWAVTLASRPADEEHTYGHTKSEYFSSGVEGALIFGAALVIAVEAIPPVSRTAFSAGWLASLHLLSCPGTWQLDRAERT